ncbi:class D sortase [Paenibacillus sp. Y412MC10]|uniref:class D sortase n=1 Tax=Geobacillus sp. (strain Y412MC10) TaxID=481743 RepID=UPI0021B34F27|nr:class D sortase [Paenibacillus sp. Y412MC10]
MMVVGMIIVSIAIFQYTDHQMKLKHALAQAEALTEAKSKDAPASTKPLNTTSSPSKSLINRQQFDPKENDVIGLLEIPKIDAKLPIIEGTDEEMLDKGVGHYSPSVLPTDGEQILLSGHRDTVFRKFADLEIGDHFIVNMPYGTFEYEMKSSKIVDKDDTSVIRSMGKEVLVLSTCYPFHYVGPAPDRYVIYAYPVTKDREI